MHQSLQGASFHLEHILPESRGGRSELQNLAWACPGCNLHKSDNIDAIDPLDGKRAPLFNPATQLWNDHFHWQGYEVHGLTPAGRATVAALHMNHARRTLIRKVEGAFGLFPPEDSAIQPP
jgi:hypothetical protein